jgi:hypothetical protein
LKKSFVWLPVGSDAEEVPVNMHIMLQLIRWMAITVLILIFVYKGNHQSIKRLFSGVHA